ncbi:hypothetical protein L218DRAFT_309113 [Marasmius fiardii PR-910]|nr:hypothetical protein L218DRAFT_309113 [Marasmius fiardii PR-910]
MTSCIILGIIMAIAHSAFFLRLHLHSADAIVAIGGRRVSIQRQASLGAIAFPFISRAFFSLSTLKAYEQLVWFSARSHLFKLKSLDALFSAPTNPNAFLSLEMTLKAKVATVMAVVIWLLPSALVPIPGALTIQTTTSTSLQNVIIPDVNFLQDPVDGAVALYDTSGFYRGPSMAIQGLAVKTLTSNSVSRWRNPCEATPCSYNQTFFAPSFNCSFLRTVNLTVNDLTRWFASVERGVDSDKLSITWVSDPTGSALSTTSCVSFNSTYDVSIRFQEGGVEGADVVVNSITPVRTFGTANPRNWTIGGSNITSSGNPSGHAFLASITEAVSTTISGSVSVDSIVGVVVSDLTMVMLSPSLPINGDENGTSLYFHPNAHVTMQNLLTNTTLGLLSMNLWNTTTLALVETSQNVFIYDPSVLWAGYGVCIGLTVVMIVIGGYSAWKNGGSMDMSVSTIIRASRNPVIDRCMELQEQEAGSDGEFRKDFLELKLGYGMIDAGVQGQSRRRMAFGVETQLGVDGGL